MKFLMFALNLKLKPKQKLKLFANRNSGTKRASIAATLTWTLKTELISSKKLNLNTKKTALFSATFAAASYVLSFFLEITHKHRDKNKQTKDWNITFRFKFGMICYTAAVYFDFKFFFLSHFFGYVLFGCCQNFGCVLARTGDGRRK